MNSNPYQQTEEELIADEGMDILHQGIGADDELALMQRSDDLQPYQFDGSEPEKWPRTTLALGTFDYEGSLGITRAGDRVAVLTLIAKRSELEQIRASLQCIDDDRLHCIPWIRRARDLACDLGKFVEDEGLAEAYWSEPILYFKPVDPDIWILLECEGGSIAGIDGYIDHDALGGPCTQCTACRSRELTRQLAPGRWVYFVQAGTHGAIKIGTSNEPSKRMSTLQIGSPEPLRLIAKIPGGEAMEAVLHAQFSRYRRHEEWFEPVPELLALIREFGASR